MKNTAGFIPKRYKKDPITIRVDGEKLEQIDRVAAEYDMSRNQLINQCVDYALKNIDQVSEQALLNRSGEKG